MTLSVQTATALVSTTTSLPHWGEISPRWLTRFLPWVEVPSGIYTLNRVTAAPFTTSEHPEGTRLRATFAARPGEENRADAAPRSVTGGCNTERRGSADTCYRPPRPAWR